MLSKKAAGEDGKDEERKIDLSEIIGLPDFDVGILRARIKNPYGHEVEFWADWGRKRLEEISLARHGHI